MSETLTFYISKYIAFGGITIYNKNKDTNPSYERWETRLNKEIDNNLHRIIAELEIDGNKEKLMKLLEEI